MSARGKACQDIVSMVFIFQVLFDVHLTRISAFRIGLKKRHFKVARFLSIALQTASLPIVRNSFLTYDPPSTTFPIGS